MASDTHLAALRAGVDSWNEWIRHERQRVPASSTRHRGCRIGIGGLYADLQGADLADADLYQGKLGAGWSGIDLLGADLRNTNLVRANLSWAKLAGSTFEGASLVGVQLGSADLSGACLEGCNLTDANLAGANLTMTNLRGANFSNVHLYETIFGDTDLSGATGFHSCRYAGPCTVDHRTLLNYGSLPISFLKGCGLPDVLVDDLPSFRGAPIRFHSCFISYSRKDQEFAKQLYNDLQANGVRPFLDSEDIPIGARLLDTIDAAIQTRDKVILVCSTSSIRSEWVEDEVLKAFAEERRRGGDPILLPIRIDDSVLDASEAWAAKLRDGRNIADFTRWKDSIAYKKMVDKLLQCLK